jgi:hypothetical protein
MGVHNREQRQKKKAKRERQRRASAGAGRAHHDLGRSIAWEFGVAMAVGEAAEAGYTTVEVTPPSCSSFW